MKNFKQEKEKIQNHLIQKDFVKLLDVPEKFKNYHPVYLSPDGASIEIAINKLENKFGICFDQSNEVITFETYQNLLDILRRHLRKPLGTEDIKEQIEDRLNRKGQKNKVTFVDLGTEKIESSYDEKGNAKHYGSNRVQTIHIFEKTFGTIAVMHFCEINALKYRLRMGKKKTQTLEQEILKAEWYEKAAEFFFDKIKSGNFEKGLEQSHFVPTKHDLPWEKKS